MVPIFHNGSRRQMAVMMVETVEELVVRCQAVRIETPGGTMLVPPQDIVEEQMDITVLQVIITVEQHTQFHNIPTHCHNRNTLWQCYG